MPDRKLEDAEQPPVRGHDDSHCAIHQCWLGCLGTSQKPLCHRRRTMNLSWHARRHGSWITSEHNLWIEYGQQRVEVPFARSGEKGFDLWLRAMYQMRYTHSYAPLQATCSTGKASSKSCARLNCPNGAAPSSGRLRPRLRHCRQRTPRCVQSVPSRMDERCHQEPPPLRAEQFSSISPDPRRTYQTSTRGHFLKQVPREALMRIRRAPRHGKPPARCW